MLTLSDVREIVTIVSVLIGAGSLAIAAFNVQRTVKTNRAKFWIELRSAFAKHDEVHRNLRPGGKWSDNSGPSTSDEYFQVESYMGLFEHCEIMMSQKLIDKLTFTEIYRYRLINIVANDWVIVEKLCNRPEGWKRLLALLSRMNIDYKCS